VQALYFACVGGLRAARPQDHLDGAGINAAGVPESRKCGEKRNRITALGIQDTTVQQVQRPAWPRWRAGKFGERILVVAIPDDRQASLTVGLRKAFAAPFHRAWGREDRIGGARHHAALPSGLRPY